MTHKYSLEHLTVLQCTPPELVYVAAEAGYDCVGLRTMPLGVSGEPECDIARNADLMRQTRRALETTGLSVSDVEVVKIAPWIDLRAYERSFAAAAELGVTDATASIWTPDFGYACASFDGLCALARPYGLRLNLEFVAIASVKTLADAVRILRCVDADNVGILLDMYHLHRAATDLAELDGLPAEWLHFCQLCDAPAAIPGSTDAVAEEVRGRRLYLGEGGIDVANILVHLPDIIYALEIPHLRRLEELGPLLYATRCLETARSYLSDPSGSTNQ